ncbi:MAG: hypothetical protein HYY26_02005 [Acidobacteria bacterium]|nr:hypothetical protein [Acidobacteriota bacterium]
MNGAAPADPAPPTDSRTTLAAILLGLACSLLTGVAQLGLKWSANRLRTLSGEDWQALARAVLADHPALAGIVLSYGVFALGLLLFLLALRRGELITIYPMLAARYVWVVAVTPLLFPGEFLNLYKLLGAGLAALGVFAVARGGLK